jgi:hypothetical protein
MMVTQEQVVQIFCAVLQAKIASSDERLGASGAITPKPPLGKIIADSVAITKEAVAALKSGEELG